MNVEDYLICARDIHKRTLCIIVPLFLFYSKRKDAELKILRYYVYTYKVTAILLLVWHLPFYHTKQEKPDASSYMQASSC